jgi:hypothetical protein
VMGDQQAVLVDFGKNRGFNVGLKAGRHMLVMQWDHWGHGGLGGYAGTGGNWSTGGKLGEGRVQGG